MTTSKIKALALAGGAAALFALSSCDTPSYSNTDNIALKSLKSYNALTIESVNATLGDGYMRGFDASMVSELENYGFSFYNSENEQEDIFQILKDNGVNYIRLRLFHTPASDTTLSSTDVSTGENDLATAISLSKRAKAAGMKTYLDIFYSDTWTDAGNQKCPAAWSSVSTVDEMSEKIYDYTYSVLDSLESAGCAPDMVSLGNEIDTGILLTNIASDNVKGTGANLAAYLASAAKAARLVLPDAKIMIHIARGGYSSVTSFFSTLVSTNGFTNFDVIGLSYYPFYKSHGTVQALASNIEALIENYGKEVVIAETSYGYGADIYANDGVNNTLWYYNDSGNGQSAAYTNLVDSSGSVLGNLTTETYEGYTCVSQSLQNQANVIRDIIEISAGAGATGIFYWGGDFISGNGIRSSWENQALFDLDGKALPSLAVFNVKGN